MAEAENILLHRFAATGDSEAFSQIVRQHAGLVYGVCLRILEDKDKAADAVQETFIQLLSNAGNITGSLSGWLHRVATHLSIDRIRNDVSRRKREVRYAAGYAQKARQWNDLSGYVDEEMDTLDEQTRNVLIRHFFEGKTTRNIGQHMGISQPTVSRRIESGVSQLRARLHKRGIIASVTALSSLLIQNAAEAAPQVVVKELGKIAIVGGQAAIATGSTTASTAAGIATGGAVYSFKAKIISLAVIAAIGTGSALVGYRAIHSSDSNGVAGNAVGQNRPQGGMMAAPSVPPASELLAKYTQALDSTQSFVSTWQWSGIGSCNIPSWGMRYNNEKMYNKGEHRTDSKGRCYEKSYRWGYVDARNHSAPEDNAIYVMDIIGDKFVYRYNRRLGTDYKGHLEYFKEGMQGWNIPDRKSWGYFDRNDTNNLFLGYIQTKARLDRTLKKARRISVREKPEMVKGSLCYVVEADTQYGRFTVWLDSEHGYHPARIKATVRAGDDIGDPGSPHIITKKEGVTRRYTLDNVRFEKVNDVWIPMEADRKHHIVLGSPEKFSSIECHFKRTKIVLNPDHDALGSFADPVKNPKLDPELRNESVVYSGDGIKRMWLDGKIVPSK